MTADQYIATLPENTKAVFETFRKIILENDKTVTESLGNFMNSENVLSYTQEGVFKYALAVAKNHISFHSLVMYSNPVLMEDLKKELRQVKFQKGCINFKSLEDFPPEVFTQHMKASSKIDYSPVIEHYKKKKK